MNEHQHHQESVFAKGMLYLGVILLLGLLLLWFFDGHLNTLYNPNEKVRSITTENYKEYTQETYYTSSYNEFFSE